MSAAVGELELRQQQQQLHSFNYPYQLGYDDPAHYTKSKPPTFDQPLDANVTGYATRPGDIVIVATDGAYVLGIIPFPFLSLFLLPFAAAAGGSKAIFRMLELLEAEILTGLRLLGLNSLTELDKSYLSKDYAFDSKNVLSAFPLIDEGY